MNTLCSAKERSLSLKSVTRIRGFPR